MSDEQTVIENSNLPEVVDSSAVHEIVEAISPVNQIETGLAKFLGHTFDMVMEEDLYFKEIKREIVSRLPSMKDSEVIALATNEGTLFNDRQSKILAPTMQLLTAAQQAEMAKANKETQQQAQSISQTNIREINQVAPQEVLTGLAALMNLANAANKTQQSNE
jgi:hypothetical protein